MEITEEIQERSHKIQGELHKIVESLYKEGKPTLSYQDCFNVVLITKLAELELKIESLENRPLPKIDSIY